MWWWVCDTSRSGFNPTFLGVGLKPDLQPEQREQFAQRAAGAIQVAAPPLVHPFLQLLAALLQKSLAVRVWRAVLLAVRLARAAEVAIRLEVVMQIAADELDHDRVIQQRGR